MWPEGGVGTLEGVKYIVKIIWKYRQNIAAKELIGLWRKHYQELWEQKEAAMLANVSKNGSETGDRASRKRINQTYGYNEKKMYLCS